MSETTETPCQSDRPDRPDGLQSQLVWLHCLLASVILFAVFSPMILGHWLRPEIHLLLLASATMICGVKGSTFFYCLGDEMEEDVEGVESDNRVINEGLGPVLTAADAMRMPIMGSFVLFGLFCVYKYLDQDIVKLLFTLYVVFMCAIGLGANLSDFVNMLRSSAVKPFLTVPYFEVQITIVDVVGYLGSAAMGYYYVLTKDDYELNWIVNNVFGVSFCLLGMKQVNISTYKAGCIMLCGLFFYDVFWVFLSKPLIGSNVMVTVAKGVKAPIKLMFPRVGKGMIFNESNVGMVPSERTAIDLAILSDGGDDNVMIGKYNSSELLGCKLICIHDEHCIGMEWNVDSPSCLLFSNAVGSLVAASSGAAVQWFVTGDKFMPSMLGLGDIVVPGIFLSLLAKFDVTQAAAQKKNESGGGGGTYWNYFNVAMVAYVLSLVATLAAMIIWEAAQPALLYIVPFLIITSGIMAWLKGDLTQLLDFEVKGDDENYSVESMINRLTNQDGTPKETLSEEDIQFLKDALANQQTFSEETKKIQ
jgi:hypothetical protein